MKIRRISYHFCPIPSFFLSFINFQIDNDWKLFRSKIIQMFFSIEDRFKTIFQKKTKLFERKEISIPLISALAPVFAYISYIYIYVYIYSISITTPMWYRVASARKFMQSSPAWMGNPREGEQENEPDSVTRRSSGNNKSRITIGNGEENPGREYFSLTLLQR